LAALLGIERLAVRVPKALGVKLTVIVQFVPAARLAPQVPPLALKSAPCAPEIDLDENESVAEPVLVTVTDCAAEGVFSTTEAKSSKEASIAIEGVGAGVPVPDNATVDVPPVAL